MSEENKSNSLNQSAYPGKKKVKPSGSSKIIGLVVGNEMGEVARHEWIHEFINLPQEKKDELKKKIEEINKRLDEKYKTED